MDFFICVFWRIVICKLILFDVWLNMFMNKKNLKVFNFSSFFLVSMIRPFLSRKVTSAIIIICITSVTDCRNKVTPEQRSQSYLAWYVINTLSLETIAQCRSMGYIPWVMEPLSLPTKIQKSVVSSCINHNCISLTLNALPCIK